MMDLHINLETIGHIYVMSWEGNADHTHLSSLLSFIHKAIEEKKHILLDFHHLLKLDQFVAGLLIAAVSLSRKNHLKFKITSPRPTVHETLSKFNIPEIIEIYFQKEEAILSFTKKSLI